MKKSIALILVSFLAFSCSKEEQYVTHENTTVEGVLLSAADRSPIANGKVLLLNSYHDGTLNAIFYGRGYGIRNVLTTDKNGRFYHSFKHADDTVYAVAAEADGFFPNRNSGGYDYPRWRATGLQRLKEGYLNYFNNPNDQRDFVHNKGEAYYPEIRLAPEGWIKFIIKNEAPAYSNDLMTLAPENSGGQSIRFNGTNFPNPYFTEPLRAGRLSRILYNVTSQGNFQFYEDSIFVVPHDTVTYELTY
jgi:hypothetical protein